MPTGVRAVPRMTVLFGRLLNGACWRVSAALSGTAASPATQATLLLVVL